MRRLSFGLVAALVLLTATIFGDSSFAQTTTTAPSTSQPPTRTGDNSGINLDSEVKDGHAKGKADASKPGSQSPSSVPTKNEPRPESANPEAPVREVKCKYWDANFVNVNHQDTLVYDYAELANRFKTGDLIAYICRYVDNDDFVSQGTFSYNQEAPPGQPETDFLTRARELYQNEVDQWFPIPTATGKPPLTNQRVGFETWLVVPGLDVPKTVGEPDLQLHVEIGPAYFEVPVRDGPTKVEKFSCAVSGIGPNGEPNGKCAHRFDYATNGAVPARLTITYTVTMTSSLLPGEPPAFVGVITRTGNVDMQVKDLQARAG